jgi:hypothetical protein
MMSKYCIEFTNQDNHTILFGPFYSLDRAYKKLDKLVDRQLKSQPWNKAEAGTIYQIDNNLFVASYKLRELL